MYGTDLYVTAIKLMSRLVAALSEGEGQVIRNVLKVPYRQSHDAAPFLVWTCFFFLVKFPSVNVVLLLYKFPSAKSISMLSDIC